MGLARGWVREYCGQGSNHTDTITQMAGVESMSSECLFWAVKTRVGNPQRKLILIALSDIANEKRKCWPSHQYLADVAECSTRSVIRHLEVLQAEGLIEIESRSTKKGTQSNMYTVKPSNLAVCQSDTGGVTQCHRVGDTVSHNTLIDTNKHICSNWEDWVTHRKQMRKPLTEKTIKLQTNFLDKFDEETRVKIIEQSIFKGWAGLFELKGERNEINQRSNSNYRPGTAAAAAAKLRERIKSNS